MTVRRPSTRERKAPPETARLSSPLHISLFHVVNVQLEPKVRRGSPADVAQGLISQFEDGKERLSRDRIPQAQRPVWMRFAQKMHPGSTNGHLSFHLPVQGHQPEQEEIAQWLQSLQAFDPKMSPSFDWQKMSQRVGRMQARRSIQRGPHYLARSVDMSGTPSGAACLLSSCAEEETRRRRRLMGIPLTDAADGSVPMSQSTSHRSALPLQKDAQRWGLFRCSVALMNIWRPPPSTFCPDVCLSDRYKLPDSQISSGYCCRRVQHLAGREFHHGTRRQRFQQRGPDDGSTDRGRCSLLGACIIHSLCCQPTH